MTHSQNSQPSGQHTSESEIRRSYEKQYPEMRGVASLAARNHYGAFKKGWFSAVVALSKAQGATK